MPIATPARCGLPPRRLRRAAAASAGRNAREDANALTVTPEALDDFFARFDALADDEDVIIWTGEADALAAALRGIRQRVSPRQPPS
ncbi:hypothetical protein [Streptomyces sp. NPDC056690]|uniref:hypothetical protein n=1 Tax=unclassified Streptomyces TaxID=2593676 RepID=UPI003636721D